MKKIDQELRINKSFLINFSNVFYVLTPCLKLLTLNFIIKIKLKSSLKNGNIYINREIKTFNLLQLFQMQVFILKVFI